MGAISLADPDSPIHLNPQAELAERVLLPGDPRRALDVAQALLDSPRMFNTSRGLWGYTGTAADGLPVTVQATGMGGPSAAIVIEELIALGASTLIRIGTCGALGPGRALGELVAVREVLAFDGASRALGADGTVRPDEELTGALLATGVEGVVAASTDLFYSEGDSDLSEQGAEVVEMEAATLLTLARRRGVKAGCLLAVTDLLGDGRERIGADELEAVGVRLGEVALAALSRSAEAQAR